MTRAIPRRTLLRGCGAALALPWLEAMGDARVAPAPRRIAFFYVPNGVVQRTWQPQGEGSAWRLSPTLEPLSSHRDQVTVVTGLNRVKTPGTDGHAQASTCWLSSAAPDELSPAGYPLKRTVDQIIADHTAPHTPFRSLELSCNPYQDNKESVYFNNISWYGHGHVARSMRDPQRVFNRLFRVEPRRMGRASVLDLVREDAHSLAPRLGQLDRRKLDEYLESVRSVERQAARLQQRAPKIDSLRPDFPATPWTDLRRDEHIQLMGDLLILALRADLTRVASLMVAPERWSSPQLVHGLFDQPIVHHSMTHQQDDPEVQRRLALLDRYHVEQYARLVGKLAAMKEADGSLLDNLLFVFGSGLSSGKTHVYSDLPIVIAGRGQDAVQPNRHLACPAGTPVANLWLSLARAMGASLERLGDSTAALPLA